VELYRDLVRMFPQLEFQASGGIGSLDDLKSLAASGVQSIIIGRSLLEGKFTVKEAVACWPNE
jgi:phosphoribosylformimino-5-aminoimidazole carboxamide ribotide isomerase